MAQRCVVNSTRLRVNWIGNIETRVGQLKNSIIILFTKLPNTKIHKNCLPGGGAKQKE
jgi:hypothetical protein